MIVINKRYRACGSCRELLPTQRFYKRKQRSRSKRKNAATRWLPDSYCKGCRQARSRAYYREVKADPKRHAALKAQIAAHARERRRRDPEFAARERQRHREWLANLSPERRAELAQDARIRAHLWRERHGGRDTGRRSPTALGAYSEHRQTTRLPPEPLLEVLPPDWHGATDTQARALYRIRHEGEHVSLAVADGLLCSVGRPYLLRHIYPE